MLPKIHSCICGASPKPCVGPDLAFSGNEWVAWVECGHCKLSGATALHSKRRAIQSWNKRNADILEAMEQSSWRNMKKIISLYQRNYDVHFLAWLTWDSKKHESKFGVLEYVRLAMPKNQPPKLVEL